MDAKWFKKSCTVSEELLLPAMTRQRYGHVAQALHFSLRPLFFSFLFPNFLIFLFFVFHPNSPILEDLVSSDSHWIPRAFVSS